MSWLIRALHRSFDLVSVDPLQAQARVLGVLPKVLEEVDCQALLANREAGQG